MGTAAQNQAKSDELYNSWTPVQQQAFKSALGDLGKQLNPTPAPETPAPSTPAPSTPTTTPTATPAPVTTPMANYDAAKAEMGDGESVEARVDKIIKNDSPLMQQAKLEAKRQSGARGLLNSSMAVGAAQQSVLKSALPIASQDATTSAQFKLSNQGAENQARQFGAEQANTATLMNRKAEIDKEMITADAEAKLRLMAEQAEIDKEILNIQIMEARRVEDVKNWVEGVRQASNQQHEINLQKLTNEQVLAREKLAGDFDVEISTNQQAAGALLNYDNAVATILNNPEMKQADKNAAIAMLTTQLETSLTIIGAAAGDRDKYVELLTFNA